MNDEEKIKALDEFNKYVHEINNRITAIDAFLHKPVIGELTINKIKEELRKIQSTGVEIRLNLIEIFFEVDKEGDEKDGI